MPKVIIMIFSILVAIIFLVVSVSSIGEIFFNKKIRAEVKGFLPEMPKGQDTIEKADLEGLPAPVRKWMERTGVIGRERVHYVRLKQKGMMRLKPDQEWMPFKAKQYFSVDNPGFIWQAKVKAAPFVSFVGRDSYQNGKGQMLIKLLSLIPVVDAKGEELDQGALLRYLGEMTWFPSGFLNPYIKWEEVDDHSARVTLTYQGASESGTLTFNDHGDLTGFSAPRYMESNGRYTKEIWSIRITGYKEFEGIRIPNKGTVTWKLKSGDFTWLQYEIEDIEYNKPAIYK